eukprot:TRINITY_DN6724_c0_g1_i2.p1 TRINITY_DN6724_c0_g1~~TRINITY_DN6724_c0_g1_i2.p1  ORF type:complete len:230 (+),score=45.80 TRINITY_DN6724_c0_g1_i2:137-826(+)
MSLFMDRGGGYHQMLWALSVLVSVGSSFGVLLTPSRLQAAPAASNVVQFDRERQDDIGRLKVEVFYESLCPFCQMLMSDHLAQIWEDEELRASVELVLYPFGNARLTSSFHGDAETAGVECQHGEAECLGNAIEACSMKLAGPEKHVPFVICMANMSGSLAVDLSATYCADRHGIDQAALAQCSSSREGAQLVAAAGAKTTELEDAEQISGGRYPVRYVVPATDMLMHR